MKVRALASFVVCCCAAAPLAAQSLSRTDILALQQQLRDDGCGISHTTGRVDAVTRRALKKCASKYNASSSTPSAVLAAMNIGLGSGSGISSMGGTLPTPLDVPTKPSTPNPAPGTPVTPGVPTPVPTAPADPNAPMTPPTPPHE
jgi:DNA-binding transcriptional LysR family regulator